MTGPTPLDPPPILPGYTVRWDVETGQWAATSDRYGTVLRGAGQAELEQARWELVLGLLDEIGRVVEEIPGHGHFLPKSP